MLKARKLVLKFVNRILIQILQHDFENSVLCCLKTYTLRSRSPSHHIISPHHTHTHTPHISTCLKHFVRYLALTPHSPTLMFLDPLVEDDILIRQVKEEQLEPAFALNPVSPCNRGIQPLSSIQISSPVCKFPVKEEIEDPQQFVHIMESTTDDKEDIKRVLNGIDQKLEMISTATLKKCASLGEDTVRSKKAGIKSAQLLTDSTLAGIVVVGTSKPPTDATLSHLTRTHDVEVFLRPARKNSKAFANFIPDKLFYKPFKYDMLILANMDLARSCTLSVEACDAETLVPVIPKMSSSQQDRSKTPSISVERTRITRSPDCETCEINFRVQFNVCSFHCHKKPFVMRIRIQSAPDSKSEIECFEYFSEQFSTFARKNDKEHDIWELINKGEINVSGNVIDQSCLPLNGSPKQRRAPRIQKRTAPVKVVKIETAMPPAPPKSDSKIRQRQRAQSRQSPLPHKRQRIGDSNTDKKSFCVADSMSMCKLEDDGASVDHEKSDELAFPSSDLTYSSETTTSDFLQSLLPATSNLTSFKSEHLMPPPPSPSLKVAPPMEQLRTPFLSRHSGSCALEAMKPFSPIVSQLCDTVGTDPFSCGGGGGDRDRDSFSPHSPNSNSSFDWKALII